MTTEAAEFPDLPAFRPGAARRAAWRGVARTSFLAIGWLIVITFVASIAGDIAMNTLGRRAALDRYMLAWRVAHPEYGAGGSTAWTSGPYSVSTSFGIGPEMATGLGPTTTVTFRMNLFGHLSQPPVPSFAATRVLQHVGNPVASAPDPRKAEMAELAAVPAVARVGAVIEFGTPLSESDYAAFEQAHNGTTAPLTFAAVLVSAGDQYGRGAYGWDESENLDFAPLGHSRWTVLSGFRKWVATLHDSDSSALFDVGVDLGELRAAASESKIYGVIVNNVTAGYLRGLFEDPRVTFVHPYDIQYAVDGGA